MSPGIEKITIFTYDHYPVAQQLLKHGAFPCAPISPSLAVNIVLLEFMRTLFVRIPPNTSSFCEALEAFLEDQGFKLQTKVSFLFQWSMSMHSPPATG